MVFLLHETEATPILKVLLPSFNIKASNLYSKRVLKHNLPVLSKTLNHVRDTSGTCQRLAMQPSRFFVPMPSEDCATTRTIGIQLMKINKATVPHIDDLDTKFSAATSINGDSGEDI